MKLGIIGPCDDELNPFLRHLTQTTTEKHAMLDFHRGNYGQTNILAVRCGVCKVNAAIAHVCYANAIPFAAIRTISDTPHESGATNMEKYFTNAGAKSVEVLMRYLNGAKTKVQCI